MNIDNIITACHQSIMYNFADCEFCNNIKYKVFECGNCKKKICNTCITTNLEHFMSDNKVKCYTNLNFITDRIAIGNHQANYDNFDIVVNLNYPANNVAHMEISESFIENKLVYKVGIKDTTNENMIQILNELIPKLLENFNSDKKILFHCYQGISRSGCIATMFISLIKNISLEESFSLIKAIRPIIAPNPGFIKAMFTYKVLNR